MGPVHDPRGWEFPDAVIDAFALDGRVVSVEPMPMGHIHRNFLVTCTGARYVVQRLNHHVFGDTHALCANVERVVAHLRAAGHECPPLVATGSGALSFRDTGGTVWRVFGHLEGTVGRLVPRGPLDAFDAARAFALYRVAVADLTDPPLTETIARFHDLPHRLAALDTAVAADPVGRRSGLRREIDRARRLGGLVTDALPPDDAVPRRVVHNDAKLANVLFDAGTGGARCVIDFDTTMPGRARSDVGELVRTLTTHAAEDAGDETVVDFDFELLAAVATGYLSVGPALEASELATLALAGPEMAVENGLRFLADHLAGDRYFTVARPAQNLDRCRTQLRLAELMFTSPAETDACFAGAARRSAAVR
jgi:N-acetylhexosamine 1-kinase